MAMAPGPLPRLFGLPWEQAPEPPGPSRLPAGWGSIQFHKSISPEIRQRLDDLAARLPTGTRLNITRIMLSPTLRAGGKYIESERILQLHPHFTAEDFYHEIGHALGLDEGPAEDFARSLGPAARSAVSAPPATPAPGPAAAPGDYVISMRQRRANPVWLDAYKKRLAGANKVAAERTKHLKGPERVRAMNAVVRELMKADRGP